MGDFLDFLEWLLGDNGPADLGDLLLEFARRPSFIFYFAGAIIISAALVWAALRFAFPRKSRIGPPLWGAGVGLLAVIGAIMALALVHYNVSAAMEKTGIMSEEMAQARNASISALVAAPVIIVGGFYLVRSLARAGLKDLGVGPRGILANFGRGLLLLACMMPLVAILISLNALFLHTIGADMSEQRVVEAIRSETSPLFSALMAAMVLLAAPMWEEFIFRGIFYNGLRRTFGRDEAILISAVVFGFIHGAVLAFLPIFLLAIFLAYAYERTGSLYTPIAMHFLFNAFNLFFMRFMQ